MNTWCKKIIAPFLILPYNSKLHIKIIPIFSTKYFIVVFPKKKKKEMKSRYIPYFLKETIHLLAMLMTDKDKAVCASGISRSLSAQKTQSATCHARRAGVS